MGLFRRRAPDLTPANVEPGWERGEAWLSWGPPRNALRESHYQEAIAKVCGPLCDDGYLWPVVVRLEREPRNRHDSNAVAGYIGRDQVGYLAAEIAAQVAPSADSARLSSWEVAGVIRGGSIEADRYGVHLWMDRLPTPGLLVNFPDGLLEVPWPPGQKHLARAQRPS